MLFFPCHKKIPRQGSICFCSTKRLGQCRSRVDFCPTGKLKLPIMVICLPNEIDVPDCAMIVISRWRH